jgi:hypothetical protein
VIHINGLLFASDPHISAGSRTSDAADVVEYGSAEHPRKTSGQVYFAVHRSKFTHLDGIAKSKASVREVLVRTPPGCGLAVVRFPLLPEVLRLGNAARKAAMSSSGGFCEFLNVTRQQSLCQL